MVKNLTQIKFLYTNIGRGHPFYLDGIKEALLRENEVALTHSVNDVFQISSGISLAAWKLAYWLYRKGSSDNFINQIYSRIRSGTNYNNQSIMLSILGRNLKSHFANGNVPIVVGHPLLVGILKGKKDLIYQHGEVIAPKEAFVKGAQKIIVPTSEVAQKFIEYGYNEDDLFVSGLCIENSLVNLAQKSFEQRLYRLKNNDILIGAFYSSGAEPDIHISKLIAAGISLVQHGGKSIFFVKHDGAFEKQVKIELNNKNIIYRILKSPSDSIDNLAPVTIVRFSSRKEESLYTTKLFRQFDFFAAPSHERTNWAIGLGLPMFVIGPCIGTFSPLNSKFLSDQNVSINIDSERTANGLGELLNLSRDRNKLIEMAKLGWGKFKIDGFNKISDYLISYCSQNR